MWLAAMVLIPGICGVFAVYLGKDFNWDLRNYHYYNAYAFLQGRSGLDMAPAQLQTYHNPLLDLPFYWMANTFPARVVGFVLGYVQGLNLSLVLLIFWRTTCRMPNWSRFGLALLVLLLAAVSPAFVLELGTTYNDNMASLFVLGALLLLIQGVESGDGKTRRGLAATAGLLMGIGAGLKPTVCFYGLATIAAIWVLPQSWREKVTLSLSYTLLAALGLCLSAGFWWWDLWTRFENPVFPYLNNIFQSPHIEAISFRDMRYLPEQFWEYLVRPFTLSWYPKRIGNQAAVDVRFPLYHLLCILSLFKVLFSRRGKVGLREPLVREEWSAFFLVFSLSAFVLWMVTFSFYRYLLVLELLIPLCIVAVAGLLHRSKRAFVLTTVPVAAAILLSFEPLDLRRAPWSDPYFEVETSEFESSDNLLVVMLGAAPMAYVIPEFPPETRFVRPEGNMKLKEGDLLLRDIRRAIEQFEGAIFLLYFGGNSMSPSRRLPRLRLEPEVDSCFWLRIEPDDPLRACRAYKAAPSGL